MRECYMCSINQSLFFIRSQHHTITRKLARIKSDAIQCPTSSSEKVEVGCFSLPSPYNIIGPTNIGGSWLVHLTTFLFLKTITVINKELRLNVLSTDKTEHIATGDSREHNSRRSSICSRV